LKLAFDDMLPYFKTMGRSVKDSELATALAAVSVEDKLFNQLTTEYLDPANKSYFDSHFQ